VESGEWREELHKKLSMIKQLVEWWNDDLFERREKDERRVNLKSQLVNMRQAAITIQEILKKKEQLPLETCVELETKFYEAQKLISLLERDLAKCGDISECIQEDKVKIE
jgi:hypothetical protein